MKIVHKYTLFSVTNVSHFLLNIQVLHTIEVPIIKLFKYLYIEDLTGVLMFYYKRAEEKQ